MKITNKFHSPLTLPTNVAIPIGATVEYHDWDKIKDMQNIAWYVENGHLLIEDGEGEQEDESSNDPESNEVDEAAEDQHEESDEDVGEEEEGDEPADEKAALIASLAELGVEVDGRTGVKKLRAMLDEALAQ